MEHLWICSLMAYKTPITAIEGLCVGSVKVGFFANERSPVTTEEEKKKDADRKRKSRATKAVEEAIEEAEAKVNVMVEAITEASQAVDHLVEILA